MMANQTQSLRRPSVAALDEILGSPLSVLNDGFVRVVDYMGSDEAIVQAARVSYGAGTKKVQEDEGLIHYLMRHQHTTPFEMCEIKLHVRVPMDCWRQWIRHRTASINEYSTRYSVAIDSAQTTKPGEWRTQSGTNKQGSEGVLDEATGGRLSADELRFHEAARALYQSRLDAGVAREQARKDLPLSTYTEAYWKVDLHNLFHFLALRMDAHAQQEIRQYAQLIGSQVVSRWCPMAWRAFTRYRLASLVLSRAEAEIIRHLTNHDFQAALGVARREGFIGAEDEPLKRSRERDDLDAKLLDLGLRAPWSIA
jgi:thymidylate synthase (FAD)